MSVSPAAQPATAYRPPQVRPAFQIPGLSGGDPPFRLPDFTQIPGMRGLKLKFDVNSKGELLVTSNLLGMLPVTTAIDLDDALAGKYGKGLHADMRDPENTSLSGDFTFHGFPVAVPPLDIGGTDLAQAFSSLSARIPEPNKIQVDGRYRMGKDGMPFHADIKTTKVAPGVYDLDLSNLKLGSLNVPVPAFLAAFVTWFLLKVLRGVDGIKLAGYGRLRVDLEAATASQQR
ncbi:MAG: hypothetical protein FJZ01_20330 [Candidatus Sericytochromatia bacterium]|nr:hypothetical protein [Candidatus Tanganyikabacteria bacterium]